MGETSVVPPEKEGKRGKEVNKRWERVSQTVAQWLRLGSHQHSMCQSSALLLSLSLSLVSSELISVLRAIKGDPESP